MARYYGLDIITINGYTRNFHENKCEIFNTLVKEMARQLKERSERERQRVEQVSKF